jgi:hypothetical protein
MRGQCRRHCDGESKRNGVVSAYRHRFPPRYDFKVFAKREATAREALFRKRSALFYHGLYSVYNTCIMRASILKGRQRSEATVRHHSVWSVAHLTVAPVLLAIVAPVQIAEACAPGTMCLSVQPNGTPGPGPSTAQCSGAFPDFIVASGMVPTAAPWFKLSQAYPSAAPTGDAPWLSINFADGVKGANDYLYALRDYSFDGMIDADFRPEANSVRPWFHMPLMNFAAGAREPIHGVTAERQVTGPELGIKSGVTVHNYAIGFYNAAGAFTIGQVWKTGSPDLSKSQFSQGAMTFKILFSDAAPGDFQGADILAGAPQWTIATATGTKTVRLMQMDVASADARAPTGWVFGTFAYDSSATDASSWRRMRPVGLSWGNDFGFTPADQQAGKKLMETTISDQIPAYAAAHLGWAGRANGPIDNPISGCLSCHSTAEFPVSAGLNFTAQCDTDAKKMFWFRNFRGNQAFGTVTAATCTPANSSPAPTPLDFSLQMKVSVQSVLQFHDINPCTPAPAVLSAPSPALVDEAPRVQR